MSLPEAKDTLLRALDQLEQAEDDLGHTPTVVHLVVVYSMGANVDDGWAEIGGWASTSGPKWIHVALLRGAADAQEDSIYLKGEDDEA